MNKVLIKNGLLVNEGTSFYADILIEGERIRRIAPEISAVGAQIIDASGQWVIPGIIDDQVHFRDPGMPHKADIRTESIAAAAGGVTSFMDMPNTKPATLTQDLLEQKFLIGAQKSVINYSFFMGVSNDNADEVLRTDARKVCGVKIFMGSSTGNMLVDDRKTLERIFAESPLLIATHCEDEATIRRKLEQHKKQFGTDIPFDLHPLIRTEEACYISSSLAVELAKKHDARLHILHISTEEETELFDHSLPIREKRITAEVCVHHLFFDRRDYIEKGSTIKCNPAIKEARHKHALMKALLEDKLDIIATDHAPHTIEEKSGDYLHAPSGLPLVQHGLNLMLDFYHKGQISKERIVEKMCHAPAECFRIIDRGYLREGYFADIAILWPDRSWEVTPSNILYKCGWSPLKGMRFKGQVNTTLVNGHIVYDNGCIRTTDVGLPLRFEAQR